MKTYLGIEFGSTRIKAVAIDENYKTISSGDYAWKASFENGIWTYDINEAFTGLKTVLSKIENRENIAVMGISGMMHGYLAFDKNWNLLVPFRTWQNTITAQAAKELSELFGFNIPQRWSIAHLYQAVLNGEEHISEIAHITTLAGYIHFRLTGENTIGICEASGMFPIDSAMHCYDKTMLQKFNRLIEERNLPWRAEDVLPKVAVAGEDAGTLTEEGESIVDGLLKKGIGFVPPEGDGGTGMTATNAVAPKTGNISAGTSIFSMVVLEQPLKEMHEEIDVVTTPAGDNVAMAHCNNCTNDSNAWVSLLRETAELFGASPDASELYTKLYEKSLEGEPDCGGVMVCNYLSGEGITHLDNGCPLVLRNADSRFTLANFFRSTLYSTMATLKLGMDILAKEKVTIESLTGHGGLFKTPGVGQKYLAAACNAPITVMETAGEGGPYGMALLAAYKDESTSLQEFLNNKVFKDSACTVLKPDEADVKGFEAYMEQYKKLVEVERKAAEIFK